MDGYTESLEKLCNDVTEAAEKITKVFNELSDKLKEAVEIVNMTWVNYFSNTFILPEIKSNNWLKMHGYPMRRRARNKKAHRAAAYKFYMSEEWRAIVRRFATENERSNL